MAAAAGRNPRVTPMVRPGFGSKGKKTKIYANHFPVKLDGNVVLFHYSVQFWPTARPLKPEELNDGGASATPPAFNKIVIDEFVKTYAPDLGTKNVAYDGRRNLYTGKRFKHNEKTVEFVIDTEKGQREDITLQYKLVAERAVGDLIKAAKQPGVDLPTEIFQALDIGLRENLSRSFVTVGRSLFSANGAMNLGEGCSAWRGFYQSLRPTLGGFTLNVDQKFSAFYDEQNVVEFARAALNLRDDRPLPKTLQDRERKLILKSLRAVRVESSHTGKKMKHKVFDLSQDPANRIFFDDARSGRKVSVADYFETTYGVRLQHPGLPCARLHKTREIYMPLEVLSVPSQKRTKALTPKQTQNIVRAAATKPHLRQKAISDNVRNVDLASDPICKDFGVAPNSRPLQVDARVLQPPSVMFGANRRLVPANGAWNMKDERFLQSGQPLQSWGVLVFCSDRDASDQAVRRFVGKLVQVGRENGMDIPNGDPPIQRANPNRAETEMKKMKNNIDRDGPECQLLLCIKFNQDAESYHAIKRTSDCVLGVPSQCALAKHVAKADMQYLSNLTMKINTKLGGKNMFAEPFRERELNHPFEGAPFMVIGADVTHPAPGASGTPSVAAMVGSIDRQISKFASSLRNQGSRREIIEDMQAMLIEMINEFQAANRGVRPQRLIYFRDGVSEGQFQQVLDFELWEMRKACMSLDNKYRPPMTVLTVQKRHNTRFFPMDQKDGDRSGNCKAGTVVDTGVAHPKYYDFFLNSHAGLQGTSKSACYTCLLDENKFTPDQLQHLAYRLCHNYARCCRSVGVVSAAYYAHHLAFRGRCFLDSTSDLSSEDSRGPPGASTSRKPVSAGVHKDLSSTMYYV